MRWERYEISLWSHQETFLATLCNSQNFRKYDANSPVLSCSTTGQKTLSFSIPIVCYNLENGRMEDNSRWYNELRDKHYLANEKRVKLIFDRNLPTQRIQEFVITRIQQARNNQELYCNITCTGLAYKWLGKIGFDITLDLQTMLLEEVEKETTFTPTINYWLDRVFPNHGDGTSKVWDTFWQYRICMNYASDATRDSSKVYQADDVVNWRENPDKTLSEVYNTTPVEKQRFIEISESNKYNITQQIAETFQVFVRYEFLYQDRNNPLRATSGVVIFYNEELHETEYVISYGNNEIGISKISESEDIVTKMYVNPVEDSFGETGYVSLSQAPANKMSDEYLLNFDYYIDSNQLTSVQIDAIAEHEYNIRMFNKQLQEIGEARDQLAHTLLENEAAMRNALDAANSAQSLVLEYNDKLTTIRAQMGQDVSALTERATLLVRNDAAGGYSVSFNRNGIMRGTVVIETPGITADQLQFRYDQFGYISSGILSVGEGGTPPTTLSFSYQYNLLGYYQQSLSLYNSTARVQRSLYEKLRAQIGQKNDVPSDTGTDYAKYNYYVQQFAEISADKQAAVREFEELMGYFIKQGKWDASDFKVSYQTKTFGWTLPRQADYLNASGFAESSLQSEIKSYTQVGAEKTKVYYDYIRLYPQVVNGIQDYSSFSIVQQWQDSVTGETQTNYYTNGAHGSLQYLRLTKGDDNWIIPVFLFNNSNRNIRIRENETNQENTNRTRLYYRYSQAQQLGTISIDDYHRVYSDAWPYDYAFNPEVRVSKQQEFVMVPAAGEVVYRRIPIDDTNVANTGIEIWNGQTELENLADFYVVRIDGIKTITLKLSKTLPFYQTADINLQVKYKKDHSSQQLYYDAANILKRSATPEITYNVEFAYLANAKNLDAWNGGSRNNQIDLNLGSVVRMNDWQLGLTNVKGIVTSLQLHLDLPASNVFTVSNYKTRFQDLFGRIVAETESMYQRSASYDRVAAAITPIGQIDPTIIQNTINTNNLVFNSGYNSSISWDENGIVIQNTVPYANGVRGQVVIKGGGILLSNSLDAGGNRIYSSALTPSGINASVLTAGRLDVNKINIYSGDELRFTWNGDGLFAYDSNPINKNVNKYICYNQQGLKFYENKRPLVSLDWDGLYIGALSGALQLDSENGLAMYDSPRYSETGEENTARKRRLQIGLENNQYGFRLYDGAGNPTMVTDESGQLWLRDKLLIGSGTSTSGLAATPRVENSSLSSPVRIWAGAQYANRESAPFRVLQDGTLYASNANITGHINATSGSFTGNIQATSGQIGGWTIANGELIAESNSTAAIKIKDANGVATTTIAPGNVNITGTINATGGKIGNVTIANLQAAFTQLHGTIESSLGFVRMGSADFQPVLTAKLTQGYTELPVANYNFVWQYKAGDVWVAYPNSTTATLTNTEIAANGDQEVRFIATEKLPEGSTATPTIIESEVVRFAKFDVQTDFRESPHFTVTPKSLSLVYANDAITYSPNTLTYNARTTDLPITQLYFRVFGKNNTCRHKIAGILDTTHTLPLNEIFTENDEVISRVEAYLLNDVTQIANATNKWTTYEGNVLAVSPAIIYDADIVYASYATTDALAKFSVNVTNINAAIGQSKLVFDQSGLTVKNGGLTILKGDSNTKVFYTDDEGNLSITGAITAQTGSIGGWQITPTTIESSGAKVGLDSGSRVVPNHGTLRIWAGSTTANPLESAKFFVTDDGYLFSSEAQVSGTINVVNGNVLNQLFVGGDNGIVISGGNDKYIASTSAASGSGGYGWRINNNGSASFSDVEIRGKLTSAVFEYNTISSVGGSLYVTPTIYTQANSDTITANGDLYSAVFTFANQTLDAYQGIKWVNGAQVKIDGVVQVGSENVVVSNVQAQIVRSETELTRMGLQFQYPDKTLTGGKFLRGTAIIYYSSGTNENRKYGLYLTASEQHGPFMDVYNSAALTQPAVRVGNLAGISDSNFDGQLNGYGLYSSNAFLRGQLRLPNAGITNQEAIRVNDQPVRFWAGLNNAQDDISKANFIVTQDGSMYANKGIFRGEIYATKGIFAGTIQSAGIAIDKTSGSGYDHFYVAYSENPQQAEDYIVDIGRYGISIWQGGLRVYSDEAEDSIYSYVKNRPLSINELLTTSDRPQPFISVVDAWNGDTQQLQSRLVTTKLHVTKTIKAGDGQPYLSSSLILDNGVWLSPKLSTTGVYPPTTSSIYESHARTYGMNIVTNGEQSDLQLQSGNSIVLTSQQSIELKGTVVVNDETQNQILVGAARVVEKRVNSVSYGFDFLVE